MLLHTLTESACAGSLNCTSAHLRWSADKSLVMRRHAGWCPSVIYGQNITSYGQTSLRVRHAQA